MSAAPNPRPLKCSLLFLQVFVSPLSALAPSACARRPVRAGDAFFDAACVASLRCRGKALVGLLTFRPLRAAKHRSSICHSFLTETGGGSRCFEVGPDGDLHIHTRYQAYGRGAARTGGAGADPGPVPHGIKISFGGGTDTVADTAVPPQHAPWLL